MVRKRNGFRNQSKGILQMRIVETATAGLVALAAQMLVIATVMI